MESITRKKKERRTRNISEIVLSNLTKHFAATVGWSCAILLLQMHSTNSIRLESFPLPTFIQVSPPSLVSHTLRNSSAKQILKLKHNTNANIRSQRVQLFIWLIFSCIFVAMAVKRWNGVLTLFFFPLFLACVSAVLQTIYQCVSTKSYHSSRVQANKFSLITSISCVFQKLDCRSCIDFFRLFSNVIRLWFFCLFSNGWFFFELQTK